MHRPWYAANSPAQLLQTRHTSFWSLSRCRHTKMTTQWNKSPRNMCHCITNVCYNVVIYMGPINTSIKPSPCHYIYTWKLCCHIPPYNEETLKAVHCNLCNRRNRVHALYALSWAILNICTTCSLKNKIDYQVTKEEVGRAPDTCGGGEHT
jgi:hypothetical protein